MRERHRPEEAWEEAEKMKGKITLGEAKDYADAARQIEAEDTSRETAPRDAAERERVESESQAEQVERFIDSSLEELLERYMDKLNELDTVGLAPMSHATGCGMSSGTMPSGTP